MDDVVNQHTIKSIQKFLARPHVQGSHLGVHNVSCLTCLYELSVGLSSREYLLSRVRMNDEFDIDAHLYGINIQLEEGQYYIGCADYLAGYQSKVFVRESVIPRIGKRQLAFAFHRVIPKLKWGQRFYSLVMRGRKKRMCKTEILGRLAYAGFSIDRISTKGTMLYYRVIKKSAPLQGHSPTFGPLIRLQRVVQGGEKVNIYKLRTMHPYAEFIQEFVYEQNDLDTGGKLKNDFRVSEEGRLFRKYFMDEIPMVINWLKRDVKFVGVRPLSEHYLSLYDDEVRELRLLVKPGLLPPYYSEERTPTDLEEVMASELKYLKAYQEDPWKTDFKYFFKIINNIFRKKLRSK